MGLFGGKDDTKAKIDELKAKMAGGQQQPQQQAQPWQQQQAPQQPQYQQQPQQQGWQPQPRVEQRGNDMGIILELGDGMSLNLPIKERMRLEEFLHIADRVRELANLDTHHQQQQYQEHQGF